MIAPAIGGDVLGARVVRAVVRAAVGPAPSKDTLGRAQLLAAHAVEGPRDRLVPVHGARKRKCMRGADCRLWTCRVQLVLTSILYT
jgi:hypothetical protein